MVDVHGPCYYWNSCWCQLSGLPLESMLMSIGYSVPRDHIDMSGLCCSLGPDRCLWSWLPPRALCGSMVLVQSGEVFVVCAVTWKHVKAHVHAPANYKVTRKLLFQWCWWLQMHNSERETWKASIKTPTAQLPPQRKSNGLYGKPWRRRLKRCAKDAKVSFSPLMASGSGMGQKQLSTVRGVGHWEFVHASLTIWIAQVGIGFVVVCLLLLFILGDLWRRPQRWGGRHGRTGKWVWLGYMMWNSQRLNKRRRRKLKGAVSQVLEK